MPQQIGSKIRKIRELKGYSQQNMADILNISQRSYSRIESGQTDTKISILRKIASALEVSIQQIMQFNEKLFFNNDNVTK